MPNKIWNFEQKIIWSPLFASCDAITEVDWLVVVFALFKICHLDRITVYFHFLLHRVIHLQELISMRKFFYIRNFYFVQEILRFHVPLLPASWDPVKKFYVRKQILFASRIWNFEQKRMRLPLLVSCHAITKVISM